MSTWAAVATGGIVSVASVIAGVVLQWKLGQKQLDRERADERTRRVAAVLGRLRPLFAQLQPQRLATDTVFVVRSFYEDPWTPIRAELGVLIASEPAGGLREDLIRLEEAVERLFSRLGFMVDAQAQALVVARGQSLGNVYEAAEAVHTEAETLLRRILDELHDSSASAPSGNSEPA